MSQTNLYRALRELLPEAPLMVATVEIVHAGEGTSTVSYPGGGLQRVRGTSVDVGDLAFVRGGVIEGQAPPLTDETIDI